MSYLSESPEVTVTLAIYLKHDNTWFISKQNNKQEVTAEKGIFQRDVNIQWHECKYDDTNCIHVITKKQGQMLHRDY